MPAATKTRNRQLEDRPCFQCGRKKRSREGHTCRTCYYKRHSAQHGNCIDCGGLLQSYTSTRCKPCWIASGRPRTRNNDTMKQAPLAEHPTHYLPGTDAKMQVMQERLERGEQAFHPLDARIDIR